MLKLKIADYFEKLVNRIDLKAEKLLIDQTLPESEVKKINKERDELLAMIRKIEKFNYEAFDLIESSKFENTSDHDLNALLFPKFAFLLDSIRVESFQHQILGCLIVTNRFFTDQQVTLYTELISNYCNAAPVNSVDHLKKFFNVNSGSRVK
jgi:hypothetical protein